MRYELIAGVHSVKVPNFLDARLNYWDTSNVTQIEERIFQFDNWNSFSIVRFDNFFLNEQLSKTATTEAQSVHRTNDPIRTGTLGGRLTSNLHLIYREEPYRVRVVLNFTRFQIV
ncbi:hypothetical protein PHET_11954 [Paragonimus heterotremus]|uniref:Uncharacterized protein n=1 Tax=Paragonimus heterotremus TaxID=100268 RepID=A0A8J4WS93_9TREM|nr:hypothetical protein PHET_11954 [Paragonimus heterotremus]